MWTCDPLICRRHSDLPDLQSSSTCGLCTSAGLVESCLSELHAWMISNKLRINDRKTDMLLIASPYKRHKLPPVNLTIGNASIISSSCTKNLGSVFNQHMDFEELINSICQSCYYHLSRISHIRRYLTTYAAEQLIHSFRTSKGWTTGTPCCLAFLTNSSIDSRKCRTQQPVSSHKRRPKSTSRWSFVDFTGCQSESASSSRS